MEDRITSIKYNAGKLEAIKRAITFVLLSGVMLYAFIKKGMTLNKENYFMIAFFLFFLFILAVGMAGYKKERFRVLSASNWKYRLYKNTNAFVYLFVRGIITAFIFTALFAVFQIRSNGIDTVLQKIDVFAVNFPIFMVVAGTYHLLIMLYIVRTGTAVHDNTVIR